MGRDTTSGVTDIGAGLDLRERDAPIRSAKSNFAENLRIRSAYQFMCKNCRSVVRDFLIARSQSAKSPSPETTPPPRPRSPMFTYLVLIFLPFPILPTFASDLDPV
nr:hypothetical protein Iba_chr01aCG6040 [Ipomoea batatas]